MIYRRLGRSGLQVSALMLGTMNFGNPTAKAEALRIVDAALDAGINLIDCADVYAEGESERIVGSALRQNGRRRDILLTSKVYYPTGPGPNDMGGSKYHIVRACENSLRNLRTDIIDIYYLHRFDAVVPVEESLAALDLLVRQGKIRYAACSTHPPWRVAEAQAIADQFGYPKFVCEQPPYNLLERRIENEYVPMCRHYDMGLITFAPLAHGVLAGRYADAEKLPAGSRGTLRDVYRQRITQDGIEIGQAFAARAQDKNCSAAQLAVAWVLRQPGISGALLGPRTATQLEELLPSIEVVVDDDDIEFCDALVTPGTHVTSYFNTSRWMP
jgi:aryl-alcohol dehydrogenase-like predicted oxidoreductase